MAPLFVPALFVILFASKASKCTQVVKLAGIMAYDAKSIFNYRALSEWGFVSYIFFVAKIQYPNLKFYLAALVRQKGF